MKKILIAFSLISLFTLLQADTYAVVSNKNMKNLSKTQIKAIFLHKLTRMDDKKLVPLNLSARDPLRIKFEKKVLHMSFSRLKAYWSKQHYLGNRPPLSMKSQNSVKAFIKKVDGAIGYINMKNIDDELKVLYKWSE